jgi:L-threonylcarbamoyladenylate synthase
VAVITEADVARLREAVVAGGVALVPTDTVYGLAAALDVPEGVTALYALKGRPRSQPCQVILCSAELLDAALETLDELTRAAVRELLPGPATCLVPDPSGRYAAAAGDAAGSVGLRAPAMTGPIAAFDVPLIATSANDPGGADPRMVTDVPAVIRAAVAVTLDVGGLPGTASAVIDLRPIRKDGTALLLRPGPDPEAVRRRLGRMHVALRSDGA